MGDSSPLTVEITCKIIVDPRLFTCDYFPETFNNTSSFAGLPIKYVKYDIFFMIVETSHKCNTTLNNVFSSYVNIWNMNLMSSVRGVVRPFLLGHMQCCQVRGFPAELGYFWSVAVGWIFCPLVWVDVFCMQITCISLYKNPYFIRKN